MPADIHVTKIVFKSKSSTINYIEFYYSNASKSPKFETIQGNKVLKKKVIFDGLNRPVRKVKGTTAEDWVRWVSFEDASGTEIEKYDPKIKQSAKNLEYTIG